MGQWAGGGILYTLYWSSDGKGWCGGGGVLVCMDRWTGDLAITVLRRIFSSLEYNGPTQT